MTKAPPVLQALLLADQIYTDRDTGKRVICGTFNRIGCREFPCTLDRPTCAFILLVEVVNETWLQLRFVNLENNEILMECNPFRIASDDPLRAQDLVIQLPKFPLPRAGIYSLECWADGTMIGSVRLQVVRAEESQE